MKRPCFSRVRISTRRQRCLQRTVLLATGQRLHICRTFQWLCLNLLWTFAGADEDEMERWLEEDFPRILERAKRRGAHLVFLDESGFMLAPTTRRTYAPRGHPPVYKVADPHGRISVIGAMMISPSHRHFGLY